MSERRRVWRCCESYPCICGMNTGNTFDEPKPDPAPVIAQSGQRFYDFCLATGGYEVTAPEYQRASTATDLTGSVQIFFPQALSSWGTVNQAVVVNPGDPVTKPIRVIPLQQPINVSLGITLTLKVDFGP